MDGRILHSSAADSGDQKDLRSVAHWRVETAGIADVFAVDEDVDVRTHLAKLGDDAVAEGGTLAPQARQGR